MSGPNDIALGYLDLLRKELSKGNTERLVKPPVEPGADVGTPAEGEEMGEDELTALLEGGDTQATETSEVCPECGGKGCPSCKPEMAQG